MLSIEEKDVLIIDDSQAIGILLKEFLNKLGLKKVHYCQNGESGIKVFKDITSSGDAPLVFLDYNLPDMTGYSIMTQMLVIRPDVKVIIASARDRTEDTIKDVIAQGAYQYLPKPIRLEKLKEIIETLKMEEGQIPTEDTSKALEKVVSSSTQISLLRIMQYLNRPESEVLPLVNRLISDKKIIQIDDVNEIACPRCSSVRITQTFHCPKCRSTNFRQDKLIEHYKCGNVSSASSYVDDKCPKCRKPIGIFGLDYRVQDNLHTCNDCGEVFSEILTNYLCLKCNDKFTLEHAKLLSSHAYSWVKQSF